MEEKLDSRSKLLNGNVFKTMLSLSVPAILGMVVIGLYNFMDAVFVGRMVGPEAMTAVKVSYPFTLMNSGIATLIGTGSASVLSRAVGRKDQETIDKIMGNLIALILLLRGSIFLGDRKLEHIPEQELARCSAAVLTGRPTPELMTCGELVAMGRYPYTSRLGILSEEDRTVVRTSMEMTETAFLRDEDFTRISDGQRQRVLLARAICQQPKLLLLDEPTSFLDIRHKLEFLLLLRKLAETQNIAVVLSLHELDLAKKIPDRILCLKNGHVDREGTPEEIFRDDYIRRLFDVEENIYAAVYGETGAPF